jgi:hypothetical protein
MLAAITVVTMVLTQSGAELNAQGETLLARGQFRDALLLFRQAAEANPRLATAFYNQALAMAGIRGSTQPALTHPTKKAVLDAAEVALKLDPRLRARAEAELPPMTTTFRGQRLLGRTLQKDTATILQGISWRSSAGERIAFLADGSLHYCKCRELPQPLPPANGKWSVEENRVTVAIGSDAHEGALGSDGVLTLGRMGRFFSW